MAVELGFGYVSVLPSSGSFAKELRDQLKNVTVKVNVTPDTSKATAAFRNLGSSVGSIRASVTPDTSGFLSKLRGIGASVEATVVPKIVGFSEKLRSAIGNQSSVGEAVGFSIGEGMTSAITSAAKRALATVGTLVAGQKIFEAGKDAFKEAANFQTTEVAFKGLLGSADLAQQKLQELLKFAAVTPFTFPDITDASRKLLAFGFTADQIIPIMQTLGDAAAAIGASGSDVNLVVRALGQILGKNKIQQEEINQIAENFPGVNVGPALAEAVGVTQGEFQKALALPGGALKAFGLDGKAAVDIILKAFKQVPGAEGAMERQSKTLNGVISTLTDSLRILAIQSLEPFLPGLSGFILNKIIPALFKLGDALPPLVQEFVNFGKRLAKTFEPLRDTFKSAGSAIRPQLSRFANFIGDAFVFAAKQIVNFVQIVRPLFKEIGSLFVDVVNRFEKNSLSGTIGTITQDILNRLTELVRGSVKALKDFQAGFDGVNIPADSLAAKIGQKVAEIVDDIKLIPQTFKDAFNGKDVELGDNSGLLSFTQKVGDALGRLNDLIKENPDLKDLIRDLGLLAGALVVLNQIPGGTKTVSSLASTLLSMVPFLLGNPFGLLILGLAGVAGGFLIADKNSDSFAASVDKVQAAFKEGGLGAAVDESLKQIDIQFDELWNRWKPKFELFFVKAKDFFKNKFADLFGFSFGTDQLTQEPLPVGGPVPTDPLAEAPLPVSAVPPEKHFNTFGEGFADAMMNQVIPAIAKWIVDNQAKISDALNNLVAAASKWAGENAPLIGEIIAKAVFEGAKEAIKKNPPLVLNFAVGVGQGPEAVFDKLDEQTRPGGKIDRSVGEFLKPGGILDQKSASFLSRLGQDSVSALDTIGRTTVSALSEVGKFTVDAGNDIRQGVSDAWHALDNKLGLDDAFASWNDDINNAWGVVTRFFTDTAPGAVADAARGLWHSIVDDLANLGIDGGQIAEGFKSITNWLINTAPGAIKDAASGMWDGIYDAFKGALNFIIRAWNGLEFKLPSFGGLSILGQTVIPGFEGPTLGTPDIPELAGGGVFTKDFTGLLRLAETPSARPEIVTPQRLMAETFRKELAAVGGGRGGVTIEHMDIREQQSASRVVDEINQRLGWMLTTRAER